jgi:hypothetical protein
MDGYMAGGTDVDLCFGREDEFHEDLLSNLCGATMG